MRTSFTHIPSIDEYINEADLLDDFDRQSDDSAHEYVCSPPMAPDPLFDHVSDPFEEARFATGRAHGEQICGPDAWNAFTDDEKYKAEYPIFELIAKLNLPLFPRHYWFYPAPRQYAFMCRLEIVAASSTKRLRHMAAEKIDTE